jgi:hypothetical protein
MSTRWHLSGEIVVFCIASNQILIATDARDRALVLRGDCGRYLHCIISEQDDTSFILHIVGLLSSARGRHSFRTLSVRSITTLWIYGTHRDDPMERQFSQVFEVSLCSVESQFAARPPLDTRIFFVPLPSLRFCRCVLRGWPLAIVFAIRPLVCPRSARQGVHLGLVTLCGTPGGIFSKSRTANKIDPSFVAGRRQAVPSAVSNASIKPRFDQASRN